MLCPCLAVGSFPLGFSSVHVSWLTLERFIFQISFKLRLDEIKLTFRWRWLFRRRWTYRRWRGWLCGQNGLLGVPLRPQSDQSISFFKCLRLKSIDSRLHTRYPSSSTHQKRPTAFRKSRTIVFPSSPDTSLKWRDSLPTSLLKHWMSNNLPTLLDYGLQKLLSYSRKPPYYEMLCHLVEPLHKMQMSAVHWVWSMSCRISFCTCLNNQMTTSKNVDRLTNWAHCMALHSLIR